VGVVTSDSGIDLRRDAALVQETQPMSGGPERAGLSAKAIVGGGVSTVESYSNSIKFNRLNPGRHRFVDQCAIGDQREINVVIPCMLR